VLDGDLAPLAHSPNLCDGTPKKPGGVVQSLIRLVHDADVQWVDMRGAGYNVQAHVDLVFRGADCQLEGVVEEDFG
jgi:hypothetical protein